MLNLETGSEDEVVEGWSIIVTGFDLVNMSIMIPEQCMTYNHLILK
jgi:hypothetical protein